jgi:hypothetical protein
VSDPRYDRVREALKLAAELPIGVPDASLPKLERLDEIVWDARTDAESLIKWHEATVPLIAALAIYGENASLPALAEKARALNEFQREPVAGAAESDARTQT